MGEGLNEASLVIEVMVHELFMERVDNLISGNLTNQVLEQMRDSIIEGCPCWSNRADLIDKYLNRSIL